VPAEAASALSEDHKISWHTPADKPATTRHHSESNDDPENSNILLLASYSATMLSPAFSSERTQTRAKVALLHAHALQTYFNYRRQNN
jgi:hypothetical protein